ncbi:MAG: UDP-N-acetylglucosamine 2-epimerase [Brevundimonas sp.]
MSRPRRICVVTGGRAEYGLLRWVMQDIAGDPDLTLQLVVTGSHLEPRFGETVTVIEADGFAIDARIPIDLTDDSAPGVARSMGLAMAGVADAIASLAPDLMLVLGDRFEILAAVQAATLAGLPVAHIAGGDVTEGAIDDAMRHAITKLAHVHLTTNEASAARVRAMGENPDHVHVVGSPGLDWLKREPVMDREALEAALGARLGPRNLLVTFHPVTLAPDRGLSQFEALLQALDALPPTTIKWLTCPNADPGHVDLQEAMGRWVDGRTDVRVHASLGSARYLGLMAQVDAVVGNSSSGLYEAPSFHVPTIDVGDRQGGRLSAASVIRCAPTKDAILEALARAETMDCSTVVNPYGDGHASARIVSVLKALPDRAALLAKRFHA